MRIFAALKLRFFGTQALYAALDLLDRADHGVLDEPNDAKIASLLIARELIRRGEIFWR